MDLSSALGPPLYSRADAVIPHEHILRFAEEQRARSPVTLEEFADSPHVSHLLAHPEQYARAVRLFLAEHLSANEAGPAWPRPHAAPGSVTG